MLLRKSFKTDTAIEAILYVAERMGERKDFHKICKILYFADQEHLSKYGRSITGDTYIAMEYGPVPSNIEDIFKAIRGESYFSNYVDDFRNIFGYKDKYCLVPKRKANIDYLSDSDRECLDEAILKYKDTPFYKLTKLSHDSAWVNTKKNKSIKVKDILKAAGDSDEYANYIEHKLNLENSRI